MKTEEINKQQDKIEKMEWETPEVVDLDVNNTKSGTFGANDGAVGYANLS